MLIVSKYKKTPFIVVVLFAIIAAIGLNYAYQSKSQAADTSKFDPGNIMSDATMSNKTTMSVGQIQTFLESKNACNNTNTYMAAWYPHLSYNIKDGKFVCMAEESFNGKSAAQIIWEVSQRHSINPQVLIVLLEKEQGLITDTWPNNVQYRTAAGFGCPDTAPCNSQYYGLENQLNKAADLFRTVLNGGWTNYPVGLTYVQYNPNTACGGTVVNIENRATSALYRYTPYQPNRSSLDAGYGTGDSCGAYGNRNFWMLFTDWFGSTQDSGFRSLEDPRWMQISKNTQKINIYTGERFGPMINPGAQAKFIDKIYINGQWIARTAWDYNNNNLSGFPASELGEIEFVDIPDTWMVLNKDTRKLDPLRGSELASSSYTSLFKAVDKIIVDNKTYYRTEWSSLNNQSAGFLSADTDDYHTFDFIDPRLMVVSKGTPKIDALTKNVIAKITEKNVFLFNKKIKINEKLYAQIKSDNETTLVIPANNLDEVNKNSIFYPFINPRIMSIEDQTTKFNVLTGKPIGPEFTLGTDAYFVDQVKVNGIWYARTQWDHDNNNLSGIRVDELREVQILDIPDKLLTTNKETYKVNPIEVMTFEYIPKGASALFKDKVVVEGIEYYRTEWESEKNRFRFIAADDLSQ